MRPRPAARAPKVSANFFRTACAALLLALLAAGAGGRAPETPSVRLKSVVPVGKGFRQFALGPDGRTLAVSHADRFVRLWDLETGALKATTAAKIQPGAADPVWSPDGRSFMTYASWEPKNFSVWDARGGALLWSAASGETIREPVWSPDGRSVLTVFERWRVRVYDAADGRLRFELKVKSLGKVAFSPDGRLLLTLPFGTWSLGGPLGGTAWDALTGESKFSLEPACELQKCQPASAEFADGGRPLAVTTVGAGVYLYDPRTGRPLRKVERDGGRGDYGVSGFSPGGRWLVTTRVKGFFTREQWLELRDPETGEVRRTLTAEDFGVYRVIWSGDGRRLVTTNHPKQKYKAFVWEPETGRLVTTIGLRGDRPLLFDVPDRVELSAGGRVLAAAGETVRFWDAERGELLLEERGAEPPVRLSRGGRLAVGRASKGGAVFVWEVSGG